MPKDKNPDRIVYSEDFKISMGDYETKGVFMSYSTNVNDGETAEDAFKRAKKLLSPALKKNEQKLRKKYLEYVDFDSMSKL